MSQEKGTARCCRRLERPGHKTDPCFRVGDTLRVTTGWRGARNSLVAGKGFLGMHEQSQNKIGRLPVSSQTDAKWLEIWQIPSRFKEAGKEGGTGAGEQSLEPGMRSLSNAQLTAGPTGYPRITRA